MLNKISDSDSDSCNIIMLSLNNALINDGLKK